MKRDAREPTGTAALAFRGLALVGAREVDRQCALAVAERAPGVVAARGGVPRARGLLLAVEDPNIVPLTAEVDPRLPLLVGAVPVHALVATCMPHILRAERRVRQ